MQLSLSNQSPFAADTAIRTKLDNHTSAYSLGFVSTYFASTSRSTNYSYIELFKHMPGIRRVSLIRYVARNGAACCPPATKARFNIALCQLFCNDGKGVDDLFQILGIPGFGNLLMNIQQGMESNILKWRLECVDKFISKPAIKENAWMKHSPNRLVNPIEDLFRPMWWWGCQGIS